MQRMCNLVERTKDTFLYRAVELADTWSPGPKGRRLVFSQQKTGRNIPRPVYN